MYIRAVCIGLGLLGFVSLVGAIFFSLRPSSVKPTFTVDEPNRVLKDTAPGQEYEVQFQIRNQTGRRMRIVGAAANCGTNCCITPTVTQPVEVPSHGSVASTVRVAVSELGPFDASIPLYLDDDGTLKIITLSVEGEAKALQKKESGN